MENRELLRGADAKKVIKECGEKELLKYWFNIEEGENDNE